jgi:hypothetical protein
MSWIRITKIIFINIVVLAILVLLLEGLFWSARKVLSKDSVGFLFEDDITTLECERYKTHPVLSHSHDTSGECKIRDGNPGDHFVFYDYDYESDKPAIVTLGGSTTSGFLQHYSNGFTWPLFLHKMASQKGYQVINGGVGGYSSSQELLKLIIEVRRLKNVKLIVSLNGINETPGYPGGSISDINTKYPFLKLLQVQMFESQRWVDQRIINKGWLPNIKSFIRFINGGSMTSVDIFSEKNLNSYNSSFNDLKFKSIDAAERWLSNVKSMYAISASMGVEYMVFLQPTMGIYGVQSRMPSNIESKDANMLKSLNKNEPEYIDEINNLYNELQQYCSKLDYCIDISSVAPPTGNNYRNVRHHNENGNKIIAEEIFKNIKL